jgi:hypothetical protein
MYAVEGQPAKFLRHLIFEFFNDIGTKQTKIMAAVMSASRGKADNIGSI